MTAPKRTGATRVVPDFNLIPAHWRPAAYNALVHSPLFNLWRRK